MMPHEARELVEILMFRMWGLPYLWGGDDPIAGMDCSGGILELLKSCNGWPSKVDATAQTLYDHFSKDPNGKPLDLNEETLLGDLVFFGPSKTNISHVGMAFNGEIMFEFGGGDSKTTTLDAAKKQNAYARFRGIDTRRDLVAFVRPTLFQSSD